MAIDREATLKNAEKFLRVGRLDAAIAEYARVVEDYPRDWTTANTLGDLYLRAAQSQKAVALYQRIADHLLNEGFYPKAAALLKKILKITPDDEGAQIHLGEISARQGLLADARSYFGAVASRRRQRGDEAGADEMVIRLGALDPGDVAARRAGAQALERAGNTAAAAAIYRDMYAELTEKGRAEDASAALRDLMRCSPDTRDADLLLPVLTLKLQDGEIDEARALLPQVLSAGTVSPDAVAEVAWTLIDTRREAAAVCVDAVVDHWIAAGHFADAAALLQELAARVPGQVAALLRLVEVCVDGGLEATMYEAQAQLADAYLASGRPDEARVIAEDLVGREPWEATHVDRLRRSLQMLGVEDIESVIAERLAAPSHEQPESLDDFSEEMAAPPAPPVQARVAEVVLEEEIPIDAGAVQAPAAGRDATTAEIDLTSVLSELEGQAAPSLPAPPPAQTRDLEEVFAGIRANVGSPEASDESGEHLSLARTYIEMGMPDEAFSSLEIAARAPRHRFEAASLLARLHRDQGDLSHAIEWYERAAEAPAPSGDEGRELLYELGDVLEMVGETARALAIFIELEADARGYRDVGERVARLSKVEAGG